VTKLIIQIPCHNEEESLPVTLSELPRRLEGVDVVEWLVIDDGSTDRTAKVARDLGVDHIVRLPRRQGLSRVFMAGLEASVAAGADVIVNTDADNQYQAADIGLLVAPILDGRADMVVGARPIGTTAHFSGLKKSFQRLGSWATRKISGTDVEDAPSGFRAVSRSAAMKLHVFNQYTYTVETIIQAGQMGMVVISVPIRTNPDLRPSRLVRGLGRYISRQLLVMTRVLMTYRPFRFFAGPGLVLFAGGFLLGLRFLFYYLTQGGQGRIQSLILAALLMGAGFFLVIVGLLADLLAVNRVLLEGVDWRLKRIEERLGDRRNGEP